MDKKYTIAVAGTGYVGLSIATLLSQHHKVYAVDIIPAKVDMVNQRKSPIQDEYMHYMEQQLSQIPQSISLLAESEPLGWETLDSLFLDMLRVTSSKSAS